jgi:DNA polymerase-3 subunit epsilon
MVFFNKIKRYTSIAPFVAPKTSGSMAGYAVCYTGIRSKEQEQAIEAAGGKVVTSVSSKTTHLVTADPHSTSGKAEKARALGVKVVGLDEMWTML